MPCIFSREGSLCFDFMKYNFFNQTFEESNIRPEKLAVSGSDRDLSWQDLKSLALDIAAQIESLNIPKGHPIVIYGHKEVAYVAAIMACYHCCMTYIPMDSIYPEERINDIKSQTHSLVLIDCSERKHGLKFAATIYPGESIECNEALDFSGKIFGDEKDPLQYIMFTSGSTGRPKGVMISRGGILSFIRWSHETYQLLEEDVFMNQAPFTFDISLCDVLTSMSNGASLVLNTKEIQSNQDLLLQRIKQYQCSVWTSTPSFGFVFLRHPSFSQEQLPSLRHFLFMGEVLPNKTCAVLFQKFPDCTIANCYGPTEASIVTTHIFITPEIIAQHPVLPVGYAKKGSIFRIKKNNEQEEYGELLIGGDHVGVGYFGDKALSASKFIRIDDVPFFVTGDYAKQENGLWFFGGRNDDQIKLHGFRIELNEISAVIEKFEKTLEACVVPLKRNNEVKKIIAFVKFSEEHAVETTIKELEEFMQQRLPYYMMPAEIISVTVFPFTASHKIDKNKLLADYSQ